MSMAQEVFGESGKPDVDENNVQGGLLRMRRDYGVKAAVKAAVKDGKIFVYNYYVAPMWSNKFKEAKEESKITFDRENDEFIESRDVTVKHGEQDHSFHVELRAAGGDWETYTYYFKCQTFAGGYSMRVYSGDGAFFCLIPGKDQGNPLLEKTKDWWHTPKDSSVKHDTDKEEKLCWESLPKMLENKLVESKKKQEKEFEKMASRVAAKWAEQPL